MSDNNSKPKLRIAVIDDEPKMTKLLKLLLEDELACEVETFTQPAEGYKRLQEVPFDLVSLDHRMPKLTGMGLIELLRSQPGVNQFAPVVIFTGFLRDAESLKSPHLENVLFLEKPIEDERYIRNVKLAIEMGKKRGRSTAA